MEKSYASSALNRYLVLEGSEDELLGDRESSRGPKFEFSWGKTTSNGRMVLLLQLSATTLATSFIIFSLFGMSRIYQRPTGREFGDCGTSIPEARSKGCIFDNMSFHWVRPACYSGDLLDNFRDRTKMPYYSNTSLEEEYRIPIEEIFRGDHLSAWAPKEHHPAHCAYLAQLVHTALVNHLPIDNHAAEYEHTRHCGMILLDDWLHEMPECRKGGCISGVHAQFTTCGYV